MGLGPTVIIPCYGQRPFLCDCLASVRSQTVADWEAIVVDDGSPDGEEIAALVENFREPRFRLLRHDDNRGLAAARNTGIRACKTEWVVLLDADDMLHPLFLERVLAERDAYPGCDAIFTDFRLFGSEQGIMSWEAQRLEEFLRSRRIPGPGVLMRRTLWARVQGYCESPVLKAGAEDYEFWLSALELGAKLRHVPEPLYLYRRHPGSMTIQLRSHSYKVRRFIYERHRTTFKIHGGGASFLADGCWKTARGYLAEGRPLGALWYALRGVLFGKRRVDVQRLRKIFREAVGAMIRGWTL